MSDRKTKIIELKKIFDAAKNCPRRDNGRLLDRQLNDEIWDALIDVGKEELYELKDEVFPYLNDPFSEFRAEAVKTLGWNSRLKIPEFKDVAHKIWKDDPDEDVKEVALAAWIDYNYNTHDPKILEEMYDILTSQKYPIGIRVYGLHGIFMISGSYTNTREGYEVIGMISEVEEYDNSHERLDNLVDWDKVNQIMKDNVPGWQAK